MRFRFAGRTISLPAASLNKHLPSSSSPAERGTFNERFNRVREEISEGRPVNEGKIFVLDVPEGHDYLSIAQDFSDDTGIKIDNIYELTSQEVKEVGDGKTIRRIVNIAYRVTSEGRKEEVNFRRIIQDARNGEKVILLGRPQTLVADYEWARELVKDVDIKDWEAGVIKQPSIFRPLTYTTPMGRIIQEDPYGVKYDVTAVKGPEYNNNDFDLFNLRVAVQEINILLADNKNIGEGQIGQVRILQESDRDWLMEMGVDASFLP